MKSKRILVVDDDRIVLESCKRIFEAEGIEVFLVSSAKEAIDLLEVEYFDLVLIDIKMPEHDGIYLLEKIKEKWPLELWPKLPVVVMSGYPTPGTISEGLSLGAEAFITKPFKPDELLKSIQHVIKRSKKHG